MLKGIGHLLNRHKDQSTIWICGTGPSLDKLSADASEISGPRIYLNRAAFALPIEPGKTYWLVADDAWGKKIPGPWGRTLRDMQAGYNGLQGCFRQPLFGADNTTPDAPRGPNCYLWHGKPETDLHRKPREHVARSNTLQMFSGTAAPAIHLAWLMGATKIILIGCDGTDGYAERLEEYYDQPAKGGFGYIAARTNALLAVDNLELELEDWST